MRWSTGSPGSTSPPCCSTPRPTPCRSPHPNRSGWRGRCRAARSCWPTRCSSGRRCRPRCCAGPARRCADRGRWPNALGQAVGSIGAFAWTGLHAAPSSPFNLRIGPHRRFTWVRADLGQFKAIKNSLGGTVNDVVLAVVAGALGSYMRAARTVHRRRRAARRWSRSPSAPTSSAGRSATGSRRCGRRSRSAWPIPWSGCIRSARRWSASSNRARRSAPRYSPRLSGFAPPTIMSQAARLQARQRLFNLVVTNVPGPQFPLYLLGRELEAIYPMVPLAENTALGIAILSYNGQLNFGLVARLRRAGRPRDAGRRAPVRDRGARGGSGRRPPPRCPADRRVRPRGRPRAAR